MLELFNVTAGYSSDAVIKNITFSVSRGETVAVIGKNGSGKTTLMKVCGRQMKCYDGLIKLDGKNISDYKPKEYARKLSLLPQVRSVPSIPAYSLVMHGRFPYMPFPRIASSRDKSAVAEAMKITRTEKYEDINVSLLSGGERQRVYLAMILAQQTDFVLLDEPSTFLDLKTQFETADIISSLKSNGKAVITVMHDVAQAMCISDKLLLMHNGEAVFYGSSEELYVSGNLEKYMEISPHKSEINGKTVYYFTRI